jgi:hypothetical protein
MFIKVLPIRGTVVHVLRKVKYYPGTVMEVDKAFGKELISRRIAEEIDPPKRKPGRPRKTPATDVEPPKKGPGRPRKWSL